VNWNQLQKLLGTDAITAAPCNCFGVDSLT
jgi:hypothetical protein